MKRTTIALVAISMLSACTAVATPSDNPEPTVAASAPTPQATPTASPTPTLTAPPLPTQPPTQDGWPVGASRADVVAILERSGWEPTDGGEKVIDGETRFWLEMPGASPGEAIITVGGPADDVSYVRGTFSNQGRGYLNYMLPLLSSDAGVWVRKQLDDAVAAIEGTVVDERTSIGGVDLQFSFAPNGLLSEEMVELFGSDAMEVTVQIGKPASTAATVEPTAKPTAKPAAVSYKKLSDRAWQKLVKAPDRYLGKTYIVWACITQFDAATGGDTFRGQASNKKRTYWFSDGDNALFVGSEDQLADFVEDDVVYMKVTSLGAFSYDTQIGGNTTAPLFMVDRISRKGSCD